MVLLCVKVFGSLKDIIGSNKISIDFESLESKSSILDKISLAYPLISVSLKSSMISINYNYVVDGIFYEISLATEIALIPAISGG